MDMNWDRLYGQVPLPSLTSCEARPHLGDALSHDGHGWREVELGRVPQECEQHGEQQHQQQLQIGCVCVWIFDQQSAGSGPW